MPVGEAMEKLEFSHIVSRKVKWCQDLLWKQFGSSLNVKYRVVYMTLYDSAVPLLGGFLEIKNIHHTKTCTQIFWQQRFYNISREKKTQMFTDWLPLIKCDT